MTTNVTQVEGLKFSILDDASPKAKVMASALERVSHAGEKASEKIKGFVKHSAMGAVGAVGLGFGLHALAEKALEANRNLEDMQLTVAGANFAFTNWAKGTSAIERYKYALEDAEEVVEKLDVSEAKLKVDRADLSRVYAAAEQMGQRYRLGQEEMIDLTEKLAATQKVLGVGAETAAMQVSLAAMRGTLIGRDKFGMMLRASVGDMKAFQKMSEPKRFEALKKAMGDLVPAAQEMGKRWTGAMFDIQNAIEQAFRDLTGPLFKEALRALGEVAKHVNKVREDGKTMMQHYGEKLVHVFHAVETASKWIAKHWKEILLIWANAKFAGFLSGGGFAGLMAAGKTAGAGGIFGALAPAAQGASTGLMTVAARIHFVVAALLIFQQALEAGADWLDAVHDKARKEHAASPRAMSALTAGAKAMSSAMHEESVEKTFGHLKSAFAAYGLKPGQQLDREILAAELRAMEPALAAKQIGMYGIKGISVKSVQIPGIIEESAGKIATLLNNFATQLLEVYPDLGKKKPAITAAPINHFHGDIKITQEFKEADPDRVFHRVVRDINDAAMHQRDSGVSALASTPGGLG